MSCHDSGTKRKFFITMRNPTSELWIFLLLISLPSTKLSIYLILITNNILLTSLILAICWMHVIYELCNRPCSPWSLCGSVIKHQSTKKIWRSEVMGTQKCSLPSSKFTIYLIMLLMSMIRAICWICVIYELCNGPCSPWSLCGSVEEHQSMEKSKGLRPWGPRNFSLFDTHDKTKNIFLHFFTKLKNLPSFLFYKKLFGKTVTKSDW